MYEAPDWVREAIFYEIFPERFANGDPSNDPPGTVPWDSTPTRENFFGGDLQGIGDKLSYLEDLGITALYLTPIFKAPSNHKYDTEDYLQVDPHFGDGETLKQLVRAAHQRSIRVILDGVFNHSGDHFWAFRDVLRHGPDSEYADWFYFDSFPTRRPPNYRVCSEAASLPKLRVENPAVRQYLLAAAAHWTREADIDGWRLDVPWKLPMDFWSEFRATVKGINPECYLVGEIWRDALPWVNSSLFDGTMNYRLRELVLDFFVYNRMDAEDFSYEIETLFSTLGDRAPFMLNLLGSHDTPRILTLSKGNSQRALAALTFLFSCPGVPMIYYGDEVGMRGGNDPLCRGPMIWDPTVQAGEILNHCRRLIQIRQEHPALIKGPFRSHWLFNTLYAFRREYEDDILLVVLNPRQPRRNIRLPLRDLAPLAPAWADLVGGGVYSKHNQDLVIEELPAPSGLVLVPVRGQVNL